MKKSISLALIVIFTSFMARIYPQQPTPKGKIEVLAVKGSVIYNGTKLKKGDRFTFKPEPSVMDQLSFSTSTDWIKVMEVSSKKIHHFYKQKKYLCKNCLFTRGVFLKFNSSVDPSEFFNNRLIFLFDSDTILLLKESIDGYPNNRSIFNIIIDNRKYDRTVGSLDTIILSYNNLYGFAVEEQISYPSFQTDSIGLSFFNKITHIQTASSVPYFHIVFIEDAIPFFHYMEMSSDEIYNELIANYIDLKYLTARKGFDNPEETKKWIWGYIEASLANLESIDR